MSEALAPELTQLGTETQAEPRGEPWAEIDLTALRHNLGRAQALAANSKVMAVIKANAYGHGAVEIAEALLQAKRPPEALAVARFSEALQLRDAKIQAPIVILEGVPNQQQTDYALQLGCSLILHQTRQLHWLLASPNADKEIAPSLPTAWLKLETGMHRLGLEPKVWLDELRIVSDQINGVSLGLLTHLACADNANTQANQHTLSQLQCFDESLASFSQALGYQPQTSIANSAGICGWPQQQGDWVRPGIMLYGSSPLLKHTAAELNLQSVMTLKAPILDIQTVQPGDSVGYGAEWQAQQSTQIATLAIGYGDGYPRRLASSGHVVIDGHELPLRGRISMDKTSIELSKSGLPTSTVATLWGRELPVDRVASQANTIGYDLLTGVAPRVQRIYHG